MAEQITRRANNVTSATFEAPFETQTVRFGVGGLNLKDSLDAMEGWSRLTNIWHEHEGEATVRPGQTAFATASGTIHSVRKLRDPHGNTFTRLWGVDGKLFQGQSGALTERASGFSGDPLTLFPHRPPLSGDPWMYVADKNKMVKVRADGLVLPIGLPAPAPATYALANEFSVMIASFDDAASWTPVPGTNATGETVGVPAVPIPTEGPIDQTTGAAMYAVTNPSGAAPTTLSAVISALSPTSGPVGTAITITGTGFGATQGSSTVTFNGVAGTPTSWSDTSIAVPVPTGATTGNVIVTVSGTGSNAKPFTVGTASSSTTNATKGYDSWWGKAVSLDLTTLNEVGGSGTVPCSDEDICHIWLKIADPASCAELRIYVIVSETFDETVLPGTDLSGVKNTDAYVKAFRPNDYVQFVSAKQSEVQAAEQARIFALRDKDSESRGYDDARDSWQERRAATDPSRAPSFQIGIGSHQWFGYGQIGSPFRRGDFKRIGETPGRDWSTVTGLIVYVRTTPDATGPLGIGFDDWYFMGGSGPDTIEPGAQQYDYRVTHYDPRTGCESNGNDWDEATILKIDAQRRGIVVTPTAYGDSAMRQRVYRRGGSLIDDWYFVGENDGDGAALLDTLGDAELTAAGTLPTDHYQAVPTIDANGNTVLAQPLPALWGPLEGMLFGCGDPHRPGHLYFSTPDEPDHWSASGNVEVCPPSEELLNGGITAHQGFVFSRSRLHFIYPNLSGQTGVTALPSQCTRGLLGRWSFCVGPGGMIFFVAEDGVFVTTGGPEEWLSEAINPLFYGTRVNDYDPIDKSQTSLLRLTCWENCLYFQYQDTTGARQVLVYSILQKFWRHYLFGQAPACLQGEDEDILVMGGGSEAYRHEGASDDGIGIPWKIRTGAASGNRREEKLFGDIFLDVDCAGMDLGLQVFLNEETHANTSEAISGTSGRQRFLVGAFGINPQKAHSISCELRGTGGEPVLYQLGYSLTLQPDLTNTRVTNWDDLNYADETWCSGVTLDCDTGGLPKTIHIEGDFGGSRFEVANFVVTANNRHKFKFSWPAVAVNMIRIRPDSGDCVTWLLYRADWIYQEEPPRISKWDIHFENQWDQYYTGLDLYCDTSGQEKRIEVYVDGVRLTNALGGNLTYWPVIANGRKVVHLTLPWGRGHVFRFKAIDDNPGLLYTHRWFLQEEPSEQANWNQNFSILGTHADKYLKAIIFECDTFGQSKSVQVEVDGTVVETLTVTTSGRRVVQLALTDQHLGRVWRMFPVDANPGRLYSAEPIFDEEPFQLSRWETQETNHGLPGWFYPLYAHITLKSTADVTLRTILHHNQTGGTTVNDYVIPTTTGVKHRRFLPGFKAGKGVLIKYILTSAQPFFLYRDETTVVVQPWGGYDAVTVQPFGNDDQDPSRPMTHAMLAAQASGGGAQSSVTTGVGG
jgi:IPT/TIG domain